MINRVGTSASVRTAFGGRERTLEQKLVGEIAKTTKESGPNSAQDTLNGLRDNLLRDLALHLLADTNTNGHPAQFFHDLEVGHVMDMLGAADKVRKALNRWQRKIK